MSCNNTSTCTCGCCEGIETSTPVIIDNDAGLSEIRFRIGTHASFKESMVVSLSDESILRALTTRADHDPTLALIDAWAVVLDVLSFYQERIIQEGFLRTSIERLSLVELARHISYRPKPGVAATAWLAFNLDESPGAATEAAIPVGMKVQSVPGQNETAQIFETLEEIEAHTEWNAIRPLLTEPQTLGKGCTHVLLKGTLTQLQIGDVIGIVGEERFVDPGSERWDIRTVASIATDQSADTTIITWREGLGHEKPLTRPGSNSKIYVFRQRASLFGYNAPDPRVFDASVIENFNTKTGDQEWDGFEIDNPEDQMIHLDVVYPKILDGSWIALSMRNDVELYRVVAAKPDNQKKFTLNTKTTKLKLDTDEHLSSFGLRKTLVLAQSEELTLAEEPILTPVFGKKIDFSESFDEFTVGKKLVITGEPVLFLQVTERDTIIRHGKKERTETVHLYFLPALGGSHELQTNDILLINGVPKQTSSTKITWSVIFNGEEGEVKARLTDLAPYDMKEVSPGIVVSTSLNQPEIVSELIEVAEIGDQYIRLTSAMQHVYWRSTVKINANVVEATHGESKTQILGSGNGALVFQKFKLKEKPLTYVASDSISGSATTLSIKVNDMEWHEVSTFYRRGANERIFITRADDDGTVYVQFGDGITGSRLPSGTDNIVATYRVGIGLSALVNESQLSIILSPQLGVKSVINPVAAFGAEDPEVIDDIRKNASLTVLNLDRIVSVLDYQYFANAFAGIGKARADLLWKGENRTLHLTLASADEGAVADETKTNLANAIDAARHDQFQVMINSFQLLLFNLDAAIKIHPDYSDEIVLAEIKEQLISDYSFEKRDFGQRITPSEIIATMHDVPGVMAVDLKILDGQDPFASPNFRLESAIALWSGDTILPAELLLIDQDDINLTVWVDETG